MWQYNARHNGVFGDNSLVGMNGEISSVPKEFKLYNNYPNPFNPSTVIKYDLPINSYVKLAVYDILGREAGVLVNQLQNAGKQEIVWNASDFPSGVYFYILTGDGFRGTGKMILVK